jgi:drug/metabolite transporter (DMT)-like permease
MALGTAVLFWGISFVATKVALGSMTPASYMFLRFVAAAIPFAGIMAARGLPRLSPKAHLRLALIALFEPGLYFIFETTGLERTSAPKASIIIAMTPVVVALVSRIFLKERLSRRASIGAAVSIVGVAVLVLADPGSGMAETQARLGDLLVGLAVLSAAFYMVVVRSIAEDVDTFTITAFQVLYGALFFALLYFVTPGRIALDSIPTDAAISILFLALFATIAAFFAYNYALSKITAGQAAVALNGIPVVTAITAWIVLGEVLTLLQAAGGVLVLVGVTVANRARAAKRRRARREAEAIQEPWA